MINSILFMPPAHHHQSLTDIEKGEIIMLSKINSHGKISKELGIPRCTISSFLERLKTRHSPYNLPHPDRPRKTSEKFNRWLVRTALIEARLLLKELKSIANIPVSEQIIRRRLREKGIRKWRALKRALLNNEHVRKRLYEILHFNKTMQDLISLI